MTEPKCGPLTEAVQDVGPIHSYGTLVAYKVEQARRLYGHACRMEADRAELLAALERTLNWLTSYPGGGTMGKTGPYEQARAAIAHAEAQS